MRKYIPYIVLIVFFVITMVFLLIPTKSKDEKIIYFKKNYNITSLVNNNDYLNIEVLINNSKSYFVDKSQIVHSYLIDKQLTSIIDLQIVDIIEDSELVDYNDEIYNRYTFVFKILFKTDTHLEWYIKNAVLMLGYNENKNYELNIGNISLIKLEKNNNIITISHVKPLIANINKNNYLAGIIVGIRSTNEEQLLLKDIRILNEGICVGDNIVELINVPEGNNFEDIVGYEFINQEAGNGIINNDIDTNVTYFLIPLYYEELTVTNYFPIEFNIIKNSEIIKFYFSGFKYFEISNLIVEQKDVIVQDVL